MRIAMLVLIVIAATTVAGGAVPFPGLPRVEPGVAIPSDWILAWDDAIDDDVPPGAKQCVVELSFANGRVAGRFIGTVAGSERDAVLTGEIVSDSAATLLQLRQDEPGYTCAYLARRRHDGAYAGT